MHQKDVFLFWFFFLEVGIIFIIIFTEKESISMLYIIYVWLN